MPSQMKEVEITPHHRPTEWVKAIIWAFIFVVLVLTLCMLFIQKPHSIGDFAGDLMNDFVVTVIILLVIGAGSFIGFSIIVYKKQSTHIIDVGQFGTVVKEGKKTVELAPIMPETLQQPNTSVNLVTPSEKAGNYLPYVKLADYLKAKGVELSDLEDCIDPPQPADETFAIEQSVHLTELQKRVLNSWERGNHGRASIHKDLKDVSEHIASNTIIELKAKGLI